MLIDCPECEKRISNNAKMCPDCGYDMSESKSAQETLGGCLAYIIGFPLFFAIFSAWFYFIDYTFDGFYYYHETQFAFVVLIASIITLSIIMYGAVKYFNNRQKRKEQKAKESSSKKRK